MFLIGMGVLAVLLAQEVPAESYKPWFGSMSTRKFGSGLPSTRKFTGIFSTRKFGSWLFSRRQFGSGLFSTQKVVFGVPSSRKFRFGSLSTRNLGFELLSTSAPIFSSGLFVTRKFGSSFISTRKVVFRVPSTRQFRFGSSSTRKFGSWFLSKRNGSTFYSTQKVVFGAPSTRKKYSRRSRKSTSTKPTTAITIVATTAPTTELTTEQKVFPWNSWQYYETVGPLVSPLMDLENLRCPEGHEPNYYYPNRTSEEHLALVAQRKGRANTTGWCLCGHCPAMATDEDSVCCREDFYFNRSVNLMNSYVDSEYNDTECWSNSELIDPSFLNKTYLEEYRVHFLANSKRPLEALYRVDFRNKTLQLWRWLSYRYLIRAINNFTPWDLGRFNQSVPACMIDLVRKVYPDPDGRYPDTGWSVFGSIRLPG